MKENNHQEEFKNENVNESNTSSESARNLLDEKVAELKAKLFMELPESADFTTDQTLIVRGIILKAVNQAVELGKLYPALGDESIKEAASSLNRMWEKLTDPAANIKAESMSKLYHLQRYIINNLVAVIQGQHTIAGVIEAEGTPYQSPMGLVSSIFAPNAFSSTVPVLEKQPTL